MYVWLVLVLVGCGRINIDPRRDGTGASDGTGSQSDGDVGSGSAVDGSVTAACASAITVITNSTLPSISTCTQDQLDACGPAATQEVVFKFTPTVTAGYSIRSYFAGTSTITTTNHAGALCQVGSCTGLSQITLTSGVTYYYVVEATGGGCTLIDFSITQP